METSNFLCHLLTTATGFSRGQPYADGEAARLIQLAGWTSHFLLIDGPCHIFPTILHDCTGIGYVWPFWLLMLLELLDLICKA